MSNTVYVTISGLTATGKSAVAGEIEIALKAIGLEVSWEDSTQEKNATHADWTSALEMYRPKVIIREANCSRATAQPGKEVPVAVARLVAPPIPADDEILIPAGDCPYPWQGDNGSSADCRRNGHCGCDEQHPPAKGDERAQRIEKTRPERTNDTKNNAASELGRERYNLADDGEKAVIRAALLCKDPAFQKWVDTTADEDGAAAYIRYRCGVKSRRELTSNEFAYNTFRDIEFHFHGHAEQRG